MSKKSNHTQRMIVVAMLAGISYVLSTFVYFPRMAPFQHMMNVITAVLLGPAEAFAAAAITGIMRMILGGRTIQALIGAVVGGPLAGILYKKTGKLWTAVLGELIGTGIISAILVYKPMVWFYGLPAETPFWSFIPAYAPSSLMGAGLGFLIISVLQRSGAWKAIRDSLGIKRDSGNISE